MWSKMGRQPSNRTQEPGRQSPAENTKAGQQQLQQTHQQQKVQPGSEYIKGGTRAYYTGGHTGGGDGRQSQPATQSQQPQRSSVSQYSGYTTDQNSPNRCTMSSAAESPGPHERHIQQMNMSRNQSGYSNTGRMMMPPSNHLVRAK